MDGYDGDEMWRVLQVADALSYLHNVERLVHLNISPQCVVITRKGMWKLMGLGFAQTWNEPGQQVSDCFA